ERLLDLSLYSYRSISQPADRPPTCQTFDQTKTRGEESKRAKLQSPPISAHSLRPGGSHALSRFRSKRDTRRRKRIKLESQRRRRKLAGANSTITCVPFAIYCVIRENPSFCPGDRCD